MSRTFTTVFFCIILFTGLSGFGQVIVPFQRAAVSELTNTTTASAIQSVISAQLLQLDEVACGQIFSTGVAFSMELPLKGTEIVLDLYPAEVVTEDFKVETPSGQVDFELPVFYQGTIRGVNNSRVALTFTRNSVRGLVISEKFNLTLGKIDDAREKLHVVYETADLPVDKPFCDGDVGVAVDGLPEASDVTISSAATCRAVEIYFEADYQSYQDWGGVNGVVSHVSAIFNNVVQLYAVEGVNVIMSGIYIWNIPDPYVSAGSTGDMLGLLTSRWNNVGNNFDGDIVHLVSSRGLGGGVAYYLNGTSVYNGMTQRAVFASCSKNLAKGLSASISSSVDNLPTFSWNVYVIAHELGHNFGLPHTHNCTWSNGVTTGAIDNCGPTAGYPFEDGPCTASSPPVLGGTIMSYCHLVSSVKIGFNNGFGTLPAGKLLAEFNAATCLTGSKVPKPIAENVVLCSPGTAKLRANGCSGAYAWYSSPSSSTVLSSSEEYNVSVSTNASYYVSCTVSGCTSRRAKVDVILFNQLNPQPVNTSACGNTNTAALSMNGCYNLVVNWYDAPSGGNLVGTGNPFTVSNLNSARTYYGSCSSNCGQTARKSLTVSYTATCEYCVPPPMDCSDNDEIVRLTLKKNTTVLLDRAATCPNNGYALINPLPEVKLKAGDLYSITLENPGEYKDGYGVWLDTDRDGVFAATEKLVSFYSGLTWTSNTRTFTVPANAKPGLTRLRVYLAYNKSPDGPCESVEYGETEDYWVTIEGNCPPTATYSGNQAAGTYHASDSINSTATVGSPTNYNAGKSISLGQDVVANSGTVFKAEIKNCP